MPSITYDGRSFMLDGRRIWIVSGSVQYSRVPRELWADRIHAAKLAGVNTIETSIVWARHEPRPGHFDFEGDNDLRHFVELIGKAGLYCILKPGPYIGSEWDFGGIPSWVRTIDNVQLRASNAPFLEASSRYITKVAEQVKDLQVSSAGEGGPILLIQNENNWTCADDPADRPYLGELDRYLREAGFSVPTISCNSLWREVEGEIDCWAGSDDMLSISRQLRTVRPERPRVISSFQIGAPSVWGHERDAPDPDWLVQRRIAEACAGCSQVNLDPLCGGTNFGFTGGRLSGGFERYVSTSRDHDAPLTEAGAPSASWNSVRKILAFTSRFSRVLANADPEYRPVVTQPPSLLESGGAGVSVVHNIGSQGSIVWIFGTAPKGKGEGQSTTLLRTDGTTIPVSLGRQSVAWCLFNVLIHGRAELDYCNLRAMYVLGKTFVCYGPAGSTGMLSINGTHVEVAVPKAKTPLIQEVEGTTLVVLSEEQADHTYAGDSAIYVNVSGLRADDTPVALKGFPKATRIDGEGNVKTVSPESAPPSQAAKVTLSGWSRASTDDYITGKSARFASIDGPGDLTSLGTPYGYGWYRLSFTSGAAKKAKLAFPEGGDRLHAFLDGSSIGLAGVGPGSADVLNASIRKGSRELVILAENLGRYADGTSLGEPKGIYGPIVEHTPLKAGKATMQVDKPLDVLAFRCPLWEVHKGDTTLPDRLTWTITHRKKSSVIMRIDEFVGRGLVVLNGEPVHFIDQGGKVRLIFTSEQLTRGKNVFQIALLSEVPDPEKAYQALNNATDFAEGVDTVLAKAKWSFARWEQPAATAFKSVTKSSMGSEADPCWWKCEFEGESCDDPSFLDLSGMTKGQVYLNDHHLGRYFVATEKGKPVGPESRLFIPRPWIRDGLNELVIFDEHGGNPSRCRIVSDAGPPPFKA